ncbi:hypothetical protein [Amycolatopsis sp. NPDC003861]
MTDSERLLDHPGTPPIKLLGLITEAYTDALMRLAYAERDRHDCTVYRKLGYDLIGAGAQVLIHACARREQPADAPRAVAAEATRELRTTLGLAEHVAGSSAGAESVAPDIEAVAENCAQVTGRLYRLAAGLSPSVIAEINPLGEDRDDALDNEEASRAGHDDATATPHRFDGQSSLEMGDRGMITCSASRPTATVLRSPSTNYPRIHRVDDATFESTGVLAPACASADSRRDTVSAPRSRQPRYRDTCAAVTCARPQCSENPADTDRPADVTNPPTTAEPPCQ